MVRPLDELPPPPLPAVRNPAKAPLHTPNVSGFEIIEELGRGGMGVVYKARQVSLRRAVALKIVATELHGTPEALTRFRAEAEAIAELHHPNIVHVYDILPYEGAACLVMEFVEGGTLDGRLAGKPMAPLEAARLVQTLAKAMQAVHERGIVHRDLKPANILLARDGTPKITDFGLAKRLDQSGLKTRSGYVMGTPHYMAPEQAEGASQRIGPATDVHALGAILYETLTGKPPFRGETTANILKQVLLDEPAPPSRLAAAVPPALEAICLRCLRKDPAQRYPSAAALADDLGRFLSESAPATTAVAPTAALPAVMAPTAAKPAAAPAHAPAATTAIDPVPRPAWRWRRIVPIAVVLSLAFATVLAFNPAARRWVFAFFGGGDGTAAPRPIHLQWQLLASPATEDNEPFDRIAFPSETIGYLASRRAVYKTVDGGDAWQKLALPPPGRVHVLTFVDDKHGWLGADKLLQTADGGATWSEVDLPVPMRAVTALAAHPKGWALAGGTTDADTLALFHKPEAGVKWERLALTGDLSAHEKWSVAALAVNESGALAILVDPDSGGGAVFRKAAADKAWQKVFTAEDDLYRIHLSPGGEAWLAGLGGTLWHSADGTRFEAHPSPDTDRATAGCIKFDPTGRLGLAPLWKGKLLVKIDAAPWTAQEIPLGYALADAAVVNAGCAFVLGADGRIARFRAEKGNKVSQPP